MLSQAGALLSWTSERADMLFRLRANEEGSSLQAPASASSASNVQGGKGADMLFVGDSRLSRRRPSAIPARDVRAADLQEEMAEQRFSGPSAPTKTAATQRTSQRAKRAIEHRERSNQNGRSRGSQARTAWQ